MNEFLKEGEQTKVTNEVIRVVKSIGGEGLDFVFKALKWEHKNLKNKLPENIEKNDIFRKRTAAEIIKDGYASGCTDFALVFIVLARTKGIPTKYVEVIAKSYFEDNNPNEVRGHVFAECYLNGEWVVVNPMSGDIKTSTEYSGYVVYAKGLDSWDLGINDIKSLREKFIDFTKKYKVKNKLDSLPSS